MDEQKYQKAKKNDPIIFLVLGIIIGAALINSFISILNGNQSLTIKDYFILIRGILVSVLMIIAFIGIRKDKIYGSIAGIIVGILYILQLNILGFVLGIAMIYDCSCFITYIRKNITLK